MREEENRAGAGKPTRWRVRRSTYVIVTWLVAAACGDGGMVEAPEPGPVASLQVAPSSHDLVFLDETVQLVATARDAAGTVVPDVDVTWSSSDSTVVAVDASGVATAVRFGRAEVSAMGDGFSATGTLRVTGPEDLDFLRDDWDGDAVAYSDIGADSVDVAGWADAVAGGFGTVLHLVVGSGADRTELVGLGRVDGVKVLLGLADGVRGTFVVSEGLFDGEGAGSFTSRSRLGGDRVERVRMADFHTSSFEMQVDTSADGGATWSPVWLFHLRRANGRPELPTGQSAACSDPSYADFDFWSGSWDVTQGGSQSGTNLVQHVASGCGVRENWTDTGGGTGVSLNAYDPRSGLWTQLWVDSGGGLLELTGGLDGADMVLEGPRYGASNIVDRVTWTPNPNGTVRQHWEASTGGAAWVTVFDGLYHPSG